MNLPPIVDRYIVGSVHGVYEILSVLSETYERESSNGHAYLRNYLEVRTSCCGAVIKMTREALYEAKRRKFVSCGACSGRRPKRSLFGCCTQCEDQSWRRPENRPCRCGKHYEPERIEIELRRGQSSLAACQNGIGVAYI
jgi:hypothetical protein